MIVHIWFALRKIFKSIYEGSTFNKEQNHINLNHCFFNISTGKAVLLQAIRQNEGSGSSTNRRYDAGRISKVYFCWLCEMLS